MKLYVFNSTEEWTTEICHAIVADTEAEARERLLELYKEVWDKPPKIPFEVKEYEIESGLALEAEGYDDSKMAVYLAGSQKMESRE